MDWTCTSLTLQHHGRTPGREGGHPRHATVTLGARNDLMLQYFSHHLAWMPACAGMTEIGMLASLRSANILSVAINAGWY